MKYGRQVDWVTGFSWRALYFDAHREREAAEPQKSLNVEAPSISGSGGSGVRQWKFTWRGPEAQPDAHARQTGGFQKQQQEGHPPSSCSVRSAVARSLKMSPSPLCNRQGISRLFRGNRAKGKETWRHQAGDALQQMTSLPPGCPRAKLPRLQPCGLPWKSSRC